MAGTVNGEEFSYVLVRRSEVHAAINALRASRAPQLTTEENPNQVARVDDHGHVRKPGTTA
jgi:hypothetical protein